MEEKKKFQMYVNPDTDQRLFKFIQEIEQEAPAKKGYVVDRIKEILRAWSGLMDIYGERDVLVLAMQLASGKPSKKEISSAKEEVVPIVPKGGFAGLARNRSMRGGE